MARTATTPTNGNGHKRELVAVTKRTNNKGKFTAKSTRTEAQEHRILVALRRGPKSTDQLRALGAYQAAARIFGLRRKGYDIVTELFDGYSADGFRHARMARYKLIGGADGERA